MTDKKRNCIIVSVFKHSQYTDSNYNLLIMPDYS